MQYLDESEEIMKFAEFLADYVTKNRNVISTRDSGDTGNWSTVECERIIQAGIEAFAKAEDVRVEVVGGTSRLIIEQIV